MKFRLRYRIFAFLAMLLSVVVVGCKKSNEAAAPSAPSTPAAQTQPSTAEAATPASAQADATATPPKTAPDVTVAAEDVGKDFDKDAAAATAKYNGKIIEVHGAVSAVAEFNTDNQYIFKVGGFPGIRCIAAPADAKACKALSIRQDATIRGKCTKATKDDFVLSDCRVITAGLDPAIKISAVALAKVFATNDRTADYEGNPVLVDGTVLEVNPDNYTMMLEGFHDGKKVDIKCMVGVTGIDDARKHAKGDHVTVRGNCAGIVSGDNVSLNGAVIQD